MKNDMMLPCNTPGAQRATRARHLAGRVAIAVGVAAPLAAVGVLGLSNVGATSSDSINQSSNLPPQLEQLNITLAPGGSQTFKIPAKNQPVQVQIDGYSSNGGLQEPAEVASALVNVNKNHVGMTWVNQNSDGTTGAGNSFQDAAGPITTITCGSSCTIATLGVSDAGNGTLVLTQNAATTSISFDYEVDVWY